MITANTFDINELTNEGARLVHNTREKSGRVLRRYLDRVLMNGMLLQHFALNQHYTAMQLEAIAKYAKAIALESEDIRVSLIDFGDVAKAGAYVDTFVDADSGVVANRYRLTYAVNEASVKQLRAMVSFVVGICNDLRAFANRPNETALQDCPDYVYRGLPCSCADSPWMVSGVDIAGGSGVLEWCVDQADAKQRFALMNEHPNRFRHLKAESWASLQAA